MERLDATGGGLERQGAEPEAEAGRAEWNLLTDAVQWSPGLFTLFGRTPGEGPLTLDELPSWLPAEDQPTLTAAVTQCLVDGRPMDCVFRVHRSDGSFRTVRMAGEPVLDEGGDTVALWALIGHAAGDAGAAEAGERIDLAVDDAALTAWPGGASAGGRAARGPGTLELAARRLPADGAPGLAPGPGGKWLDALDLPDGGLLLTVGDLSGRGATAEADMATALGGIRGIALTGAGPAALLGHLNHLLDGGARPVLASALCCRYEPGARLLTWAQAGHPAPLLYRSGRGRALPRPRGTLLGAMPDTTYAERVDDLEPGDVLVLHTDGLFSDIAGDVADGALDSGPGHRADPRLLGLAARLTEATTAAEALDVITEARNAAGDGAEEACVLVARVRR
ncbi:SpoIIE family protein phosphatase [Streptomyces sp. RFCAC02]|uniref:SpoIIE family protein phosphatase n=1 Tax=Streptomyces sp. RFCAC02 TaxID=2499143 RepID=UPI00101FAB99|nr:SpoIIE family protein phosphatase [Streptomyces sp. RFCAC02]